MDGSEAQNFHVTEVITQKLRVLFSPTEIN